MKAYIPVALIAGLVIALPAAAATLADVQRALALTGSMTADFVQTAANGRVARGSMVLKRPGRIRFDYAGDKSTLVVADGQRLSFIDYKVSQVSQWPLRATPLGVLLDPKADLGRVARVLEAEKSALPGQIAVLARDPKRADLGTITFFLKPDAAAPGGLQLTGWRVIDAQSNLTVVALSNVRLNPPVSDSLFAFRDPRPPMRPGGRPG